MSSNYYAYAAIGVRIDPESLEHGVKKRACGHELPKKGKYCPECGKPLWYTEKEAILAYNEEKEELLGYKVVFGTDQETAVVCLPGLLAEANDDDDSKQCASLAIRDIDSVINLAKDRMKADLSPLGLWDEKEFGLHAVLLCSY